MTTRHPSVAAAVVVVVQELDGVVDGPEFIGSALLTVPLALRRLLERPVPLRLDEIALPLGKPRALHFDASAFGSLSGRRGVKNPMFLKVWSVVSSDTPTIKTSA